jgi:methylornithine synthase
MRQKLPVMISPGTLPDRILVELARTQVTWYAGYKETHNKALYKTLRPGQVFKNIYFNTWQRLTRMFF